MNPTRSENFLALSYITSFLLSTTSSILFIVVYQHWVWTLGHCVNPNNCLNCILYGVNTFETFMGGDVKVCQFCSYALVPSIIISLALGIFHIYRRCMSNNLNSPKISVQRIIFIGRRGPPPCKLWIPAIFCTLIIFCLSFVHAIVITRGYLETCNGYRKHLISLLGSRGNEAQVIHDKLSCGSILNFMDYLHPDDNNWQRSRNIDTGLILQLTIIGTWLNSLAWIIVSFMYFIIRKKKNPSHIDSDL